MAALDNFFQTIKGIGKIILLSRPCSRLKGRAKGERLIIMANGPSLADTIRDHADILRSTPTMAVNFAAIAPEFVELKPSYYVLADPHFFSDGAGDANLQKLRHNLGLVDCRHRGVLVALQCRISGRAGYAKAKECAHSFVDACYCFGL